MSKRPMRSLDEFAGDARVEHHLDRYTDRSGLSAFHTYDQAPVHDGPITAADVLMANLLSLRLGWDDVIPLFAAGDGRFATLRRALDDALSAARQLPALEQCTPDQATMPLLRQASEIAFSTTIAVIMPNVVDIADESLGTDMTVRTSARPMARRPAARRPQRRPLRGVEVRPTSPSDAGSSCG